MTPPGLPKIFLQMGYGAVFGYTDAAFDVLQCGKVSDRSCGDVDHINSAVIFVHDGAGGARSRRRASAGGSFPAPPPQASKAYAANKLAMMCNFIFTP